MADESASLVAVETGVSGTLHRARMRARNFQGASLATATLRVYRANWDAWESWAWGAGCPALPALGPDVAAYLAIEADAGRHPTTLQRIVSAIRLVHELAGAPSPLLDGEVARTLRGIRRTVGIAHKQAAPLGLSELAALVRAARDQDEPRRQARDAALVLVGWAGALRRSEISHLEVADLDWQTPGVVVTIRRGKRDQEGAGRIVALPYGRDPALCPPTALRAWLDASGHTTGRLFRGLDRGARGLADGLRPTFGPDAVYDVLQRLVIGAGLARHYSPHSLRAGFCTAAARADIPERQIARQTGHKSMTVLRGYIRDGTVWTDCAVSKLI